LRPSLRAARGESGTLATARELANGLTIGTAFAHAC
jgi:hypothetical protein